MTTHCVFAIADGCFALDVALVVEVVPYEAPLRLPGCRPAVLGLVQRRGQALAAVDLAVVLGLPAAPAGAQMLVLGGRHALAAVPITALHGVAAADPGRLRAPDPAADPPWMSGIQDYSALPGRTAAVLDPDVLLARFDILRFNAPDNRSRVTHP